MTPATKEIFTGSSKYFFKARIYSFYTQACFFCCVCIEENGKGCRLNSPEGPMDLCFLNKNICKGKSRPVK